MNYFANIKYKKVFKTVGVVMKHIVVYGKKNDISISALLAQALSKYEGVEYFNCQELKILGNTPAAYILYDTDSTANIECNNTVFILKRRLCYSNKLILPENSIVIFEGGNIRSANYIGKVPCSTICCGAGPKDTVSLSANMNERVCISLQRKIVTLSGNIIEPMEIAINHITSEDPYTLPAVCAALLVCDIKPLGGIFSF